jgi:hypothetical protein
MARVTLASPVGSGMSQARTEKTAPSGAFWIDPRTLYRVAQLMGTEDVASNTDPSFRFLNLNTAAARAIA